MSKGKARGEATVGCIVIILMLVIGFIIVGPKGCSRKLDSWSASAYGSDWLVVHYTQNGDVINSWELNNKSVGNEDGSDGIYFTDNEGNVVHLSGHYVYVQIVNDKWEEAKQKFLKLQPKK